MIIIDAAEVTGLASAMGRAPGAIEGGLTRAASVAVVEGIGLAQGNAPVKDGVLRASIGIIEQPTAAGASFGTSLEYAAQREFGGTITGNPWLVFQIDGQWVKVRSVTQTGSHYMRDAAAELQPRLPAIYANAVGRELAGIL